MMSIERGDLCPQVFVRNKDHSNHPSRCNSTTDCPKGQLCCFFGDVDNRVCRLGVAEGKVRAITCIGVPSLIILSILWGLWRRIAIFRDTGHISRLCCSTLFPCISLVYNDLDDSGWHCFPTLIIQSGLVFGWKISVHDCMGSWQAWEEIVFYSRK